LQLSIQKGSDKNVKFEIYYNLGIRAEKTGNYDLSTSYFKEAVNNSTRKNLANTGNAYNHIGQIALLQGKYDEAIEFFPKALNIRIQLGDIEGQASSYRNIGTAHQKGEQYLQAQEQYERSLELYSSLNNEMGQAACFINLGGLWLEQDTPLKALEFYLKTEKIYTDAGSNEQLWNIYYNIGSTYDFMNEIKNARQYYLKMVQMSRLLSSPAILAQTYCTVGTFYDNIQQPDSAVTYYSRAIEIANSSNLFDLLLYACEQRSRIHALEGRYLEAYSDLMVYNYAYDEVNNKENVKAFTQKSENYKFEIKQQEQLFRNRIQRIFIITLSVIVLLVGAMGVVSYRAFVQKKK
jgi:tetratricopeptide (TPR) repeat protein